MSVPEWLDTRVTVGNILQLVIMGMLIAFYYFSLQGAQSILQTRFEEHLKMEEQLEKLRKDMDELKMHQTQEELMKQETRIRTLERNVRLLRD